MTSKPTDQESKANFHPEPLKTLRVWFTGPDNGIMNYISSNSLADVVLEAIPLENKGAKKSILVDLAVVGSELNRVSSHFVPVTLPLSDVSMISLVPDSKVVEKQTILRHYSIHTRYMQQYIKRGIEGRLPPLVASWYEDRFIDMILDERKAHMQEH